MMIGMMGIKSLADVEFAHGGKATGLRALIERGLPVPDGIALDTGAVVRLLENDPEVRAQLETWVKSNDGRLAVRSSATNEDGVDQSFAGMYESVLEVPSSPDAVLSSIRQVATSGQSARVLSYAGKSFDIIPVVVQRLVEARLSGVLFSKAIDSSGTDCIYIEWVEGLGDALVSGRVIPASVSIPWDIEGERLERSRIQTARACIEPSVVEGLIRLVETLGRSDDDKGWDIEWAVDADSKLWALQMRPATANVLVPEYRQSIGPMPAAPGTARGPVRFVDDTNHGELENGDILVASITEVDYIPAMKRAAAIVTEEGGLLSHAAIVARELGKPCVVGAAGAMSLLKNGNIAEVNGTTGSVRQGDVLIGSAFTPEIDWTYLYVYDRGFELKVSGVPIYAEPTVEGLIVYLDDEIAVEDQRQIEVNVRKAFHRTPILVRGDKRIWYREWRRFNQLRTVTFVHSQFVTAIAAWNKNELRRTIQSFKNVASMIPVQTSHSEIERLFWGEIGAALHATVAVEVEGYGLWSSYRDSASWRAESKVKFAEFVGNTVEVARLPSELAAILDCLAMLAEFRNSAYPFFSAMRVFDTNYFGDRESLVRQVCTELNVSFDGEDPSLTKLYRTSAFRKLDRQFLGKAFAIFWDEKTDVSEQ